MSTHVNGIVASTRRLLAIEDTMRGQVGRARQVSERAWQAESDARLALTVTALRAGVSEDTMRWAIEMQSELNRARVALVLAALRVAILEDSE